MVAAALVALPAGKAPADDHLAILGRRLMGLLDGPASACRIASAYLAGIGGTDFRRVAVDLGMPAMLAPARGIVETEALRTWLGTRIRTDFETGAVVDVDGWRLSRTEVGACVLVAGVI
ncbi:MAG TPA: hypothetical protein VKI44_01870 [Acetobacteraceae bacterium]|nr:hypothetical protein [Acetobacteraceae bacterium]